MDNSYNYIQNSYLQYAIEVIMERAIPKHFDGLKPVHRKVLFAMDQLNLGHNEPYKKSARVVGDTIGKYHPHGDAATYETMVRLSQPFNIRYPLVDGQGNFGSPDGDSAAAMRYTECRLTEFAEDVLLKDLDDEIVEYENNYDNTTKVPLYFASRLPLSLLNGTSGIAVGLTTDIPSHNLNEIAEALIAVIKNKDTSIEEIMEIIKGPDFPCGGQVVSSKEQIRNCYETGEGTLKVAARYEFINLERGKWYLKVYNFPPNVNIQKIEETLAGLANPQPGKGKKELTKKQIEDKKLVTSILEKTKSLSGSDGGYVNLYPKSSRMNKDEFLGTIFKILSLVQTIKIKFRQIQENNKPDVLGIKESLSSWVDKRFDILTKRTNKFLRKTESRIHILEGRVIVKNNVKEVVDIITQSENPKDDLQTKLNLSEIQAEDILEIKLRFLSKMELNKIIKELKEKEKYKKELLSLLSNEEKMNNLMIEEIEYIKNKYSDKRRTLIEEKDLIKKTASIEEKVTIILSKEGWLTLRKGHDVDLSSFELKVANDSINKIIECYSNQNINILVSNGRSYSFVADTIPSGKGSFIHTQSLLGETGKGEDIIDMFISNEDKYLLSTNTGYGFITTSKNLETKVSNGKEVMTYVDGKNNIMEPKKIGENTHILVFTTENRYLIFNISEINELSKGKGVQLIKIPNKEFKVKDIILFNVPVKIKLGKKSIDIDNENNEDLINKRAQRGKVFDGKVVIK